MQWQWWALGGGGFFILIWAVISLRFAFGLDRRAIAMRDTGTLPTSEVERLHRAGERGLRCEIEGVIECESPLSAPTSGTICVAYRRQVVSTTEKNSFATIQDKHHSREFTTVGDPEERSVRFYVRDAHGRMLIDPIMARIDMPKTAEHYDSVTSGVDSMRPTTVDSQTTEHALAVGSRVYVLGYLGNLRSDVHQEAVLTCHPQDRNHPFLISYRDEQTLRRDVEGRSNLLYLISGSGVVGGIAMIVIAFMRLTGRG
ncbi:MAG: hypothetical protein Fur005_18180 [Roseiflexaceae bacterium]